ncbi:serine/threonine-protein kinase, partial [Actinocorallia lasiicapitis]
MELPAALGPYRPLDRVGAGGMGEVFLARDGAGRLLAVKTIRPDLLSRPDLRVRLLREAESLAGIRSPYVAELVSYDVDASPPYLALRLIEGRSLTDLVAQDGPLPVAELWRLAAGLAEALTAVHGAGVLHRDLKPSNVIVTADPSGLLRPVVIDFGLAHLLDATRLSRAGRASGTPPYMSPELLATGSATPASDVFSWAATVLFAATARNAHWSLVPPAELARILYATPLPPPFRDLLDEALSPTPQARPTTSSLLPRLAPLAPTPGRDIHRELPFPPTPELSLTLPGPRSLRLALPATAAPGTKLTVPGEGHLGANGGPPGSLHLTFTATTPARSPLPVPPPGGPPD